MLNLHSISSGRSPIAPAPRGAASRGTAITLAGVASALLLAATMGSALAGSDKPQAVGRAAFPAARAPVVAARYPLDPICPWGRIGDGQGILVRCLQQQEAIGLLAGGAGGGLPASMAAPAKLPVPTTRVLFRSVGEAQPDSGSLPEARPQLSKPKQRYVQCVENNGGIEGSKASVVVKFLVRERGRAEGVSVKKRRGVSEAAAKCIAEVVDRRYVGFPEAPIVGATLEIRLGAEPIAR